jgi:XTP/dITP diphosphohydrolase
MRLCFATNNIHKIEEVRGILGPAFSFLSLEEVGCKEELAEDQDSLSGNSLQKARYVFTNYRVASFADDSGLEVVALNNAPGVYSARYAGPQRSAEDNMNLLLKNMRGQVNRRAQFRTVITLALPSDVHQFEGIIHGEILQEKRGSGGFGYDPLFLPDGFSKTLAEMSPEEKSNISHRAIAIRSLAEFLRKNPLT